MKANLKTYISIVLAVCLLMALVSLAACKDKNEPEQTPPAEDTPTTTVEEGTTPKVTLPKETTSAQPTDTVTYPSDEENDPKQEDVFFD